MFRVNQSLSRSRGMPTHIYDCVNGTNVQDIGFHRHHEHTSMNVQMLTTDTRAGQKRSLAALNSHNHIIEDGYAYRQTLAQMIPKGGHFSNMDDKETLDNYMNPKKRRRYEKVDFREQENSDKIPRNKRRYPSSNNDEIPVCSEHDLRKVANNRERQRTKELNVGFANLRNFVPMLPSDKQSKIQTLRLTSQYIQFLNEVLLSGVPYDQPMNNMIEEYRKALKYGFSTWRMQRDEVRDYETMS
ncbi:hypothetical protein ACOME3_000621 [Neoechinorhynchus agilis]